MNGAQVLVGSCPADDIVAGGGGNSVCYDITDATANPIEGDCPVGTYGQYVYIYKPGMNQFALCEVEVYGTAGKMIVLSLSFEFSKHHRYITM